MDWWMCQFTVAVSPICRVCTQIPAPMETLLDYTCTRVHAYTCVYTCIVLWYEPLHVSRPWRERRPGSPLNPLTVKIRRTWKEVLPVSIAIASVRLVLADKQLKLDH